ncbi:hypothetical protein DXG03_007594 [Asterophora parasitica]|uniref:Uncharacterized protein n=1 Tax=Asterophora parasitica TaxID=117018 RepID=A0A9P7G0M1_9AGAR|nr:hypothetical protein DXG03_007594 [Asterophora parasitica]
MQVHEVPLALHPPPPAAPPETPPPPPPATEEPEDLPQFLVNAAGVQIEKHSFVDGLKHDSEGFELEEGAPPPPHPAPDVTNYSPFTNCAKFELSELLFTDIEMRQK